MSFITNSDHICSLKSVSAFPAGYSEDEKCICLETAKDIKASSSSILQTSCGKIIHFDCAKQWINGEDGEPNLEHQKCMFCRGEFIHAVKLQESEPKPSSEKNLISILTRVLALFPLRM